MYKRKLNNHKKKKSILEWGRLFLEISKEGLKSRNKKNSKDKNETIFLKNVENYSLTKNPL